MLAGATVRLSGLAPERIARTDDSGLLQLLPIEVRDRHVEAGAP